MTLQWSIHGNEAMTRQTISDFASETASITGAFFVRNAIVLIGLAIAVLMGLR